MQVLIRMIGVALLAAFMTGCASVGLVDMSGLMSYSDPSDRQQTRLPGRVYILRGIGHVWSGGMTELAHELNRRGTTASAHRHGEWWESAEEAIKLYKSDPDRWPIVLIGHSNGGDNIINMAYKLKEAGVPVALAIGFDPTRFNRSVPSNVSRFINLYQSLNVLGGGSVAANSDFKGQLLNVDLRNHFEIGHMNIDRIPQLHKEVIAKVLQVVAFPQQNKPLVSFNYVVPSNAPIELWDGGMPVTAEPGQTVKSLASLYGVPAWAIRQASRLDSDDEIAPGKRVVIPRYANSLELGAPAMTSSVPMNPAPLPQQRAPVATVVGPNDGYSQPRRGETSWGQPRIGSPRMGAVGE